MSGRTVVAVAAAAFVVLVPPAEAQEIGVGGGAVFESYTFSEPDAAGFETISLLTAPFGATVVVGDGVELTLAGAFARGELTDADGTSLTISGLTDTRIRASWSVGRDLVRLSAAAFLPTGKVEHTADEARVAGAVAYDLLPFRISNWGTGGGGDASVAVALPVSEGVSLGARVGYRLMAEHEPFTPEAVGGETFVYDPGDQLYARVALDAGVGAGSTLSLSATWQTFGEDASGGANLYQTGDRLQGVASLVFPTVLRGSGWVYGGAQHRSEGTFLDPTQSGERPAQTLFFAGAGARLLVGGWVALPAVDVRALSTEDGLGQGFTAGVGGSLEIPVDDGPDLVPTARLRLGNLVVDDDNESTFLGFELGLTVQGVGR